MASKEIIQGQIEALEWVIETKKSNMRLFIGLLIRSRLRKLRKRLEVLNGKK